MFKACAAIRHGIHTFSFMKKIAIPLLFVLVSACSGPLEKKLVESAVPVKNDPAAIVPAPDSLSGCYQMIIGKDTAWMNIILQGNSLIGKLNYKRFEKDNSTGGLQLQFTNGKWEGWYDFLSEGKASVRQIIFKYDEGTFEEAYGDVIMKQDSVFYKYPSTLNFERGHPFRKMACK